VQYITWAELDELLELIDALASYVNDCQKRLSQVFEGFDAIS